MTCSEIEKRLPAYLEGLLSREEKKAVEDHLNGCERCRAALADLKRMQACLGDLEEVETPPFFEQRIMAQVRAEAAQKQHLLQRFFRPLSIKIPIQAVAVLLVAVLAVYVYHKNEPEMRQVVTLPIPKIESGKDRSIPPPPENRAAPSVTAPTQPQGGRIPAEEPRPRYAPPPQDKTDKSTESKRETREERTAAAKPASPMIAASGKGSRAPAAEAPGQAKPVFESQGSVQMPAAEAPERKRKLSMADAGHATMKSEKMRMAAAPSARETQAAATLATIELIVRDGQVDDAVREIGRRLKAFNARMIEHRRIEGGEVLKVGLAAERLDAFLDQIAPIGRLKMDRAVPAPASGPVVIPIRVIAAP